jgi:hypothetical protein
MPGMPRSAAQNGTKHAASRTDLCSDQFWPFWPVPGVPDGILLTTHLGTAKAYCCELSEMNELSWSGAQTSTVGAYGVGGIN